MSIGINNISQNCYYVDVSEKPNSSSWLMSKYLDWQRDMGVLASMAEFARFLDVGEKALNTWINGRNNPSYKTVLKICKKLGDYTLLELLGYQRQSIPFDFLPPEFLARLQSIDSEIKNTLRERAITEYSSEAEEVALEILEKYGAKLISTPKSGKSSN